MKSLPTTAVICFAITGPRERHLLLRKIISMVALTYNNKTLKIFYLASIEVVWDTISPNICTYYMVSHLRVLNMGVASLNNVVIFGNMIFGSTLENKYKILCLYLVWVKAPQKRCFCENGEVWCLHTRWGFFCIGVHPIFFGISLHLAQWDVNRVINLCCMALHEKRSSMLLSMVLQREFILLLSRL